jgi:hypothetical protein
MYLSSLLNPLVRLYLLLQSCGKFSFWHSYLLH